MKKIFIIALCLFFGISFSKENRLEGVDLDLSKMSGTMVYAQVYQMVTYPEKFIGKRIKMKGNFSSYYDEVTKKGIMAASFLTLLLVVPKALPLSF